ncbi:MAG: TlpA family protein disulfide reductase [Elusimicrobia bacterium]|nr:TlpA family protein disulfide reductase [Elusimicrobiota bacterium]
MKKIVIIAAIVVLAASVLLTGSAKDINQAPGSPGEKAIDFTLKNLAGKDINLMKDFTKRKVIILVFSATWCPYCVQEIPALKAVYDKYNYKGVEIIHVDPQESRERVQWLVDKYKIPYPVLLDENGQVIKQYKVPGLPTIIFLDQKRVIKWRFSGGEQDYDSRLKELGIK